MPTWYELAKDFAGPAATVIASATAAVITYRFGSQQTAIARSQAATAEASKDIARSQRDIAYDKLKQDLFENRYEIYSTAIKLVDRILGDKDKRDLSAPEMLQMLRKLDEARFFFPTKGAAIFRRMEQLVEMQVAAHGAYLGNKGKEEESALNDLVEAEAELFKLRASLPDLMEKELGFAQLITATA
jgi:hypothetical protein